MERLVDEMARTHQRAVSLVGYSLGGVFARELARRHPRLIRLVVTLGAPFRLSNGRHSHVWWLYEQYSHMHVDSGRFPAFNNAADPLPVPATSIYSRSDGVVAWQSCVEPTGPTTENIEVIGSHSGLCHHPAAVYAVANRLAQPQGRWTPFAVPSLLRPLYGAQLALP
jgi:pimeloyl-ACP methyl ester carboxylesterase